MDKIFDFILKITGLLVVFIILFPILWLVRNSIIESVRMYDKPPALFFVPTLRAYYRAFSYQRLAGRMVNSIVVSVTATLISVFAGSMAAYAISRFKLVFSKYLPFVFLFIRMLPGIVLLLPVFLMYTRLNFIDTYHGLILMYGAGAIPSVIWLMWSFYKDMPREIEESAYIDGSGYFNTFLRIIVPITTPAHASVAILSFTGAWNEYMMATILTRTRVYTLPPAVVSLMSQTELAWDQISAGGVVLSIPIIILCVFAQKYFIQGLTVGAVKG
jgi:multiple sugar transport system permease protein